MAPYLYQPLDSTVRGIRVLLLEAGPKYADIRCQLRHERLDSNPNYEALSYVWGNTNNRRAISLHGHTHRVTASLECALRHLRHPVEARLLWVDALCINQEDIHEREQQVKHMGAIY
ncbi:HET-domain-containing protein, partial [Stipitochalara longipes BDJ]